MIVEFYLKENIDDQMTVKPWHEMKSIPLYLRNTYHFYGMTILEIPCILVEVVDETVGIDQLKKHMNQIEKFTDRQIVLFYKKISRFRRKSLIQNHISFVIEDGQMYMPFLGLDLKKVEENVEIQTKRFSISAQIAYLYFLYHEKAVVNVTDFASEMGFTKMRASRALNDLYHARLLTYEIGGKTGRSKAYRRIQDPDYFLRGRELLKSPVKEIVHTNIRPQGVLKAGFDALADLTMINPPKHRTVAMDIKQFDKGKIEIIENRDLIKDMQLIELQLWNYDPTLFSDSQYVDLLSLYASLKDERDERVEQALEEVLREEKWYTD
jgi:hypothetical protein